MISYKVGDIFDYITDDCILLYQVNCQGVVGAGIAKTVKTKYPYTFEKYKNACDSYNHDEKDRLLGEVLITREGNFYIGNCFGQLQYGKDKRYTDYDALRNCFTRVTTKIVNSQEILIPYKIGCGNIDGDWDIVYRIIEEVFKNYNVVIVIYKEK